MKAAGKIAILAIAIFMTAVFVSPAHAQLGRQTFQKSNFTQPASAQTDIDLAETEFSKPGILPDHPLYFLKRLGEGIRLIFAPDSEKPHMHLELAKTRLAEARKLVDEKRPERVKDIIREFNHEINQAEKSIGQNISVLAKEREGVLIKSTLVLGMVLEKAPEQVRPAIEHALNNSIEKRVRIKISWSEEEQGQAIEKTPEEIKEEVEEEKEKIREKIKHAEKRRQRGGEGLVCIQVITPARNPETGEVRDFPTPCDVPEGWVKVEPEQATGRIGVKAIEGNREGPAKAETPSIAAPAVPVAAVVDMIKEVV